MDDHFSNTPLRLPVESNLDDLTRAIASLTDQVGKLGAAEERTQRETARTADSLAALEQNANRAWSGFKDGIDFASTWADRIGHVVDRVTELSSEQERLDTNSARLRLDFDEGAAAAGRFADETEAMGAATRFAAAQSALSQQEMNALMRVAGATSQMLGITTAQAVDRLTQGILTGTREGLQPFGRELTALAGGSHSVEERLHALVQVAGRTTQATDNASDSVARLRDQLEDTQRTIATSFMREWARLSDLGSPFRSATADAEELNREMQAVGQTAARVTGIVGNTVALVGSALAAGGSAAWGAAQRGLAAVTLSDGPTEDEAYGNAREIARFGAGRLDALLGISREGDARTTEGGRTTDPARIDLNLATPDIIAAVNAQNERERAAEAGAGRTVRTGGGGARGGAQQRDTTRLTPEQAAMLSAFGAGGAAADAIRAALDTAAEPYGGDRAALTRANTQESALRRRASDDEADARARSQRAADEVIARGGREEEDYQQRVRDRDAQRDAQRFAQSDAGLSAANDNDRQARNERRSLDLRRQQLRSFTDFFEEQHSRQIVAAQEASTSISGAFSAMGEAYSKHLQAVIAGREDLDTALQGMLSDTLLSISKEAAGKAGFYAAEALASLVFYQYDRAATAAAAAAAYTGVAVASGLAGQAVAPSTPSTSGGGSVAPSRPTDMLRSANDNARGGSGENAGISINYWSPVIGGRDGTDGEVGRGVQRYTRAADRRRPGRTGTDG